ncbi:hypothetical protein ODJ79_21500 [Actinoplanes sp. KI2]|uniref:hypothetical protein n=1 Tax=Actinoplanes sp. KI2 TaxID=2983315 RepID=UPI0021D5FBF3|nr:hypothetical protein [Actinoplanes sp. KI2]MCU7726313.1 hypothetical protein [Actinoplanes sp. KI2]
MKRSAVALIPVLMLGACRAEPQASPAPCVSKIETGALPEWARIGFSGDGSGNPHVFSKNGDMVGVLFGTPLSAPPAADHSNKILWVSKPPVSTPSDFSIVANLVGTGETVRPKVDPAPGPSIIDLPRPGCWRLTLSWSGHVDTMDLTYSS